MDAPVRGTVEHVSALKSGPSTMSSSPHLCHCMRCVIGKDTDLAVVPL